MSTPPKEPKPDEARRGGAATLESTYLGVAPVAPEPVAGAGATPAASPAAAGSAIIATPMISLNDPSKRGATGSPQPASPAAGAQPPPARPTGLQGGWQSAGIPRALGPEQTALHGSPGGWPMPPVGVPAAPAQQPAAQPPAAPQHTIAAPQPPATPQQPAVAPQQPAALPPRPAPHAPVARAATPAPGAVAGLQHTALASDYLRGARDASLGAEGPVAQRPAAPAQPPVADFARQTAYSPVLASPAPQQGHWLEPAAPPAQQPPIDLNATAASGGPVSPLPVSPAPASPPPTQGPPPTAQLSSPVVFHTVVSPVPERGPSPGSMGTQASVAPPPGELGASFHGPMAPVIQQAAPAADAPAAPAAAPSPPMAAAPSPVRQALPQHLVGTMLDRTPSIPGRELSQGGPPPPANPTLRFEQVPPPRSSLAQQATSFGLNIPIDHNSTHWGRPAHDGKTKALPGRKPKARSQWRMVLLAALALVSVVFAAFGPELRELAQAELNRRQLASGGLPAGSAAQTTLNNLPSPGAAAVSPGEPVAATAASIAAAAAPLPASGAAAPAAAEPASAEVVAAAMPAVEATPVAEPEPPPSKSRRGKNREAKALAEAAAAASPESKLAAEAGRHVLAARFADALPLYRSLQRDYPHNGAYAAMTKVLEQKLSGARQSGAQP